MPLSTDYESKTPDQDGFFHYTSAEQAVWKDLFDQQMTRLRTHACSAYLQGQDALGMTGDAVPQVQDVDAALSKLTGAGVAAVDALIPQDEFSTLLSNRRFPVESRRLKACGFEKICGFHRTCSPCLVAIIGNNDF